MSRIRSAKPHSEKDLLAQFLESAEKVIIGRRHQLQLALAALLSGGHILIEDLPGVGKTTFVLLLAKLLGLEARRIQFTVDLLPSDILGTMIFKQATHEFTFHRGPIFSQLIIADELNRASPKTQSALLQAMEEGKISLEGQTHDLPTPFFVFATQNPLQQAGTNPLPESQLDRFMISFEMGALTRADERRILEGHDSKLALQELSSIFTPADLKRLQELIRKQKVSDNAFDYLQDALEILRKSPGTEKHLSPRSGHHWVSMAKAWSFLEGRAFVLPDDFLATAQAVLGHRLQSGGQGIKGSASQLSALLKSVPMR
ncbi:MAG: AAA family ATPase [Bdellovibrionales bacterium]|nr:AAA family ATPase [Bdellovibrionales bacterium]